MQRGVQREESREKPARDDRFSRKIIGKYDFFILIVLKELGLKVGI